MLKGLKGVIITLCWSLFFPLMGIAQVQNQSQTQQFINPKPIEIGAIFNLTGTESPLDIPTAKGAQLAVYDLNQSGGVLGRPIRLIIKNSETDYNTAEKAAEEFAKDPNIEVVIGLNSTDYVLRAAPILAKAHKIFISTGATSAFITRMVPKYLFLTCFDNRVQAASAAEYAYKFLYLHTAVVIYDKDIMYARNIAHYFNEIFQQEGGKILFESAYSHNDCDFHTNKCDLAKQIQELKQLPQPPQCIFLAAGPTEAGLIIKKLRDSGYKGAIIGGDSFVADTIIKLAGPAANNVSYMTHGVINTEFTQLLPALMRQYLATMKFYKLYQVYYHKQPQSVFAALGYDTVHLVAAAINLENATTSDAILEGLHELNNFVGVTGKIDYSDRQTVPIKTVSIVNIQNQKAHFIGNWIPSELPATHTKVSEVKQVESEAKVRED